MRKLIAALAAALALATACDPIASPATEDSGPELAVQFGDSLSVTSTEEIQPLYDNDALWRVSLNHYGGTRFDTAVWANRYGSVTDPGLGGQPASTVILALGTNDIASTLSGCTTSCQTAADIKADARHAIATVTDAGAARVVVVNVNETSAGLYGGAERVWATVAWNDWLDQAEASTHPDYRALDVADWAAASSGHPDWLADDHLHHNAPGQAAYAQFLYDARLPGGS